MILKSTLWCNKGRFIGSLKKETIDIKSHVQLKEACEKHNKTIPRSGICTFTKSLELVIRQKIRQ